MNKRFLMYVVALALSMSYSYAKKTIYSGTDIGTTAIQYAPIMPTPVVTDRMPTETIATTADETIAKPPVANAATTAVAVIPTIVATTTPCFWHRLGSGVGKTTTWVCGLPHRVPTYLLTQLFKLPGLNLLFGEKTAQVVAALGLLALCLYNPAAMPIIMAQTVNILKWMLTICGSTELICKILISLHNNHPRLLWLFAPAIVVLLSAMLYTYSLAEVRDMTNQVMQEGTLKTKRLLTSTMELLPTYITQPVHQGYTTIWTLLGYPTKEIALVETCIQETGKGLDHCAESTVSLAQVGSSTHCTKTLATNVRNHLGATRKVASSIWSITKASVQRLKSFFVNKHEIAT